MLSTSTFRISHLESVDAWKYCSTEQLFCFFSQLFLARTKTIENVTLWQSLKKCGSLEQMQSIKKWDPCPALIKINRCTLRNCKASWRAADGFYKPLTKLFYEMFLYTLSENYYYLRCLFDDFDLCFGKACRQPGDGQGWAALLYITIQSITKW